MAVALRIIRLTQRIDEGDHDAYDQLKALAKTDPDARRVLKTVREPAKPAPRMVKMPERKPEETFDQIAARAKEGDEQAISSLRRRAEYEDIKAQFALAEALASSNPDEARGWYIRSSKFPESREALRRMAARGDQEAKRWIDANERTGMVPGTRPKNECRPPERDDLGYIRPPSSHKRCRIGDVYRINDAKLQTGQKNTMVLIKEMKGDFVTVWTVTREPGKHKAVKLIDPSLAGFASPNVYVITEATRVYRKDGLAEYRGSLGERDIKQFRLSYRSHRPGVLPATALYRPERSMIMIVAATYDNGSIWQHFGRTQQFKMYRIEDGKVAASEVIGNGGNDHHALIGYLKGLGVSKLVCGGLGEGAMEGLGSAGIEVYPGNTGDADAAIERLLAGQLEPSADAGCECHRRDRQLQSRFRLPDKTA